MAVASMEELVLKVAMGRMVAGVPSVMAAVAEVALSAVLSAVVA